MENHKTVNWSLRQGDEEVNKNIKQKIYIQTIKQIYTKRIQRKVFFFVILLLLKKTSQPDYLHNCVILLQVLALQARDKAAMLMVSAINIFWVEFMWKWSLVPRGGRDAAYVLGLTYHQRGCRDVTCKPAIPECFRVLFLV